MCASAAHSSVWTPADAGAPEWQRVGGPQRRPHGWLQLLLRSQQLWRQLEPQQLQQRIQPQQLWRWFQSQQLRRQLIGSHLKQQADLQQQCFQRLRRRRSAAQFRRQWCRAKFYR